MNPSAAGWIEKAWHLFEKESVLFTLDKEMLYDALRTSGFVYGTNVAFLLEVELENTLTEEESCKLNLFTALTYMHLKQNRSASQEETIEDILTFYQKLNAEKLNIFDKVLVGNNPVRKLEKVIHSRIQAHKTMITKSFTNVITNALMLLDVLAYQRFLEGHQNITRYAEDLEQSVTTVVVRALNSKEERSEYDDMLIRLLQSSLRYYDLPETQTFDDLCVLLNRYEHPLEKWYMMDLACMAIWNDETVDHQEDHFVRTLGENLSLEKAHIDKAIAAGRAFIIEHRDRISFFNHSNPVKHFYDQSGKMVRTLVLRNKKRLTKELYESRELMLLLAKSTNTDLTEEERKKMKQQLLDVFKTIPSLAIFALPGGTVLLPLVVSLIPKLLPSAFDDNRLED